MRNPPKAQVRRLIARILHPTEGLVLCNLDAKAVRGTLLARSYGSRTGARTAGTVEEDLFIMIAMGV